MTLWGMDVSSHQLSLPTLLGQQFLAVRACYGVDPDTKYQQYARAARDEGLLLIAYLFGRDQDPAAQVRAFLTVAGDADAWVIDYEQDPPHPTSIGRDQVREVIRRVQSTGRKMGLYDNEGNHFDAGQDWHWLAHYSDVPPSIPYDIWQRYSGRPRGDRSELTLDQLRRRLGVASLIIDQDELHSITVPTGTQTFDALGRPTGTTSGTATRQAQFAVNLEGTNLHFWVLRLPNAGNPTLTLVRRNAVTDNGAVSQGGASQADLDAAKAEGFDEAKGKAITAVQGI